MSPSTNYDRLIVGLALAALAINAISRLIRTD